MSDPERPRVVVVGGGAAGLTAGTYTARHDLETVVVSSGEPILTRNAFLENFPGFPAGVDSNLFIEMLEDGARRNGALLEDNEVTRVEQSDGGFTVELADDDPLAADYVVAASWPDSAYLDHLPLDFVERGPKRFVDTGERGRTDVDGLYAAGRVAKQCHQAVVAAGHGAAVATMLLEESDVPFYHDWVAPDGYFSGRGRDIPPGCEEIDGAERRRRERRSREVMTEYFAEPYDGEPTQHPSVDEDAYDDI